MYFFRLKELAQKLPVKCWWIWLSVVHQIDNKNEGEGEAWKPLFALGCFTFIKFTARVNFTNVLPAAFMLVDPESVKNYWWLNCIFYAFGIFEHKSCE